MSAARPLAHARRRRHSLCMLRRFRRRRSWIAGLVFLALLIGLRWVQRESLQDRVYARQVSACGTDLECLANLNAHFADCFAEAYPAARRRLPTKVRRRVLNDCLTAESLQE